MHKYLKTIVFIAGALAGIVSLLGIQKLTSYETISALLTDEAASAVVRNYGPLAVGVVGIVTALIRLSYTNTQQSQEKRSDLFERFRKSSEMLDSNNMAVRQAGIYTLAEIAKEQPAEFYIIVQSLFCGFLRHASAEQKELHGDWNATLKHYVARTPDWPPVRADMEDAINQFSQLRSSVSNSKRIEKTASYEAELRGLFIPGFTTFRDTDFSNSNLEQSVFCDTVLTCATFDRSNLDGVNMDRAKLIGCRITRCHFQKITFRWSAFSDTICTGFADDRVDLTGAMANNSGFYVSDRFNKPMFETLSDLEAMQPQFESFKEQDIARSAAIETEEFETLEEIFSSNSETE